MPLMTAMEMIWKGPRASRRRKGRLQGTGGGGLGSLIASSSIWNPSRD
jgi:hypothetical protein